MPRRSCRRHGEVHGDGDTGGVHGGGGTQGVCSQVGIPRRRALRTAATMAGQRNPTAPLRGATFRLLAELNLQFGVGGGVSSKDLHLRRVAPLASAFLNSSPKSSATATEIGSVESSPLDAASGAAAAQGLQRKAGTSDDTRHTSLPVGVNQRGNRWLQLTRSSSQMRSQRRLRRPPETSEVEDVAWRAGPVAVRQEKAGHAVSQLWCRGSCLPRKLQCFLCHEHPGSCSMWRE